MKCTIPEISWHNRDPVLSIDIQTKTPESYKAGDNFWRLATGGADSHVLIWHLTVSENGVANITCVADLERHQKAVNVVRFSPSSEILATGDDDTNIILWKHKDDFDLPPLPGEENLNKEQWSSLKVLKGHLEDVYDISWSPDSKLLVSGSVDNSAIVWDVHKGRTVSILQDYKGFVQGVSWDPCNQYICTLSTDRQCRLVDVNTMKTVQRVHKSKIPTPSGHPLEEKTVRLFHDDTFKSFFRRLTFTVDGNLIIAPSGIIDPQESTERLSNATIVFSRHNLKEPIMILPSLDESTIAVRCCPIYFKLRKDGPASILALPYRMVFAVATQHSVLIYDTQQISPIAIISNIHYTRLTDVAWSSDGRILVVSSTDGYCSIIHFHENELGIEYEASEDMKISNNSTHEILKQSSSKTNENIARESEKRVKDKKQEQPFIDLDSDAMDVDITESKDKLNVDSKPIEIDHENPINDSLNDGSQDIKLVYTETSVADVTTKSVAKKTPPKADVAAVISARTPRRVKLITISSPKRSKKD